MIVSASTEQIDRFLRDLDFRIIHADHPITGLQQVCFVAPRCRRPQDGGIEHVDFYWSRAHALSAAIRGEA